MTWNIAQSTGAGEYTNNISAEWQDRSLTSVKVAQSAGTAEYTDCISTQV